MSAEHGRVVTTDKFTSHDRAVEVYDQDAAPTGAALASWVGAALYVSCGMTGGASVRWKATENR